MAVSSVANQNPSTFREILIFFDKLGVYDVILPFLLVFTIVFAILEKTKVLGVEEIDGTKYTRKNLNAIVAFVIGFLVVASARLVETITAVSSQVVILLLLAVFFLLLVGAFYKEGEMFLEGGWKKFFMFIMFIGIAAIFLEAVKMDSGEGFLSWLLKYIYANANSTLVGSIILIVIVIGFMMFIIKENPTPSPKKEEKK